MQASLYICMIFLLIPCTFGRYNSPADPVFSDDVTDYDSPAGIDYYDAKDYPVLPREVEAYRKTKPGGLISSSDGRQASPSQVMTTTAPYKSTRRPRRRNRNQVSTRPRTDVPVTTTTSQYRMQRTSPKPSSRREGGRLIIDGSDPNTDLSKILRESRRRPTEAPKMSRNLPPRDIVGNEIKPETASNRFVVLGSVQGCRETKQEDYQHNTRISRIKNPDPTVTGLTVEIPKTIPRSVHKFESIRTGGKMFELRSMSGQQGSLKMKWYSCPARATG